MRIFFGRDGVVGINPSGQMLWDGLWHSRLVQTPGAQAGDSNWWMAVSPALAHRGAITEACVIGAGVGVTASTLAKLAPVERIDAYEINHTLARVYRAYPEGTMHAAENPRIRLIWQDARTGLTLRDAKYDVITTAPLYLRQSGAALLNSLEFYRLLASRLKPGGVVCLYSYGTAEQAFAVRQTARRVFRHGAVCYGGYLALLSDEPIDLSRKALEARLESGAGDPLWEEVRLWAGGEGIEKILKGLEAPPLSWGDGRLLITDDHPIVEYPHHLRDLVSRLGYREKLDLRPAGEFMNATEAAPENGR
jgi:protein-L-isoaspartate O-methyltransferase